MRKASTTKKKAKGTERKSRVKKTVAAPPINNIGPPSELSKEAQSEWNEIVPFLEKEQILTSLDRKILMMYCNELAKYWSYSNQLDKEGIVLPLKDKKGQVVNYMPNPLCVLSNKALDNATKIGAQFGLTPLSRTKITVSTSPRDKSPEAEAQDQYKDLLGKMGGKQVKMTTG